MIGVIDYEAGNIASVSNALRNLEISFIVSGAEKKLKECTGIILPGVGAAPGAMDSLRNRGLVEYLQNLDIPLLGICLGMQLLFERSEEGSTACLGVIQGDVKALDTRTSKIPHMGWNEVEFVADGGISDGLPRKCYFYFAHSFYTPPTQETVATVECGVRCSAMVRRDWYYGVQFHPEKSGGDGLRLLKNFDEICKSFRR